VGGRWRDSQRMRQKGREGEKDGLGQGGMKEKGGKNGTVARGEKDRDEEGNRDDI